VLAGSLSHLSVGVVDAADRTHESGRPGICASPECRRIPACWAVEFAGAANEKPDPALLVNPQDIDACAAPLRPRLDAAHERRMRWEAR